jgi:hypothetical protein
MGPKQVHAMPDDFHPEMDQHGVGLRSVVSQAWESGVLDTDYVLAGQRDETAGRFAFVPLIKRGRGLQSGGACN